MLNKPWTHFTLFSTRFVSEKVFVIDYTFTLGARSFTYVCSTCIYISSFKQQRHDLIWKICHMKEMYVPVPVWAEWMTCELKNHNYGRYFSNQYEEIIPNILGQK